jgi:hypothetical protein
LPLSTLVGGTEGGKLLALLLLLLVLRHGGHRRPLNALARLLQHLHHCFVSANSLITRRYLQQARRATVSKMVFTAKAQKRLENFQPT